MNENKINAAQKSKSLWEVLDIPHHGSDRHMVHILTGICLEG